MSVFSPFDVFFSANRPFFLADVFPTAALERARLAAASEIPVFISGERGVGKETLARLIAATSERSQAPFVKVRCDRLSPRQAASLLTVCSEDAANSAFYARAGDGASSAFKAIPANGASSTVALDDAWAAEVGDGVLYWAEVDALPARAQRRLATLLAENAAPFSSILGSSRSFVDAARDGALAPELKSTLTAFPIFLPSLFDRRAEIAKLLPPFLRDAAQRLGVLPLVPTERDLGVASKINFRQNIRDLRRYCEIATLQGDFPRTLPAAEARLANLERPETDESRQVGSKAQTLTPNRRVKIDADADDSADQAAATPLTKENFPTLDAAAKAHVVAALRLTGGIVEGPSGAAALLAINPHTLRARMRKLGLDWAKIRDESR
ncbi:MAG: sigma 54-interacting transcriptional regulator [Thermoguttaceae bacterium]|nr:sigma 54-interacting transcriptional regulator [Thermoguttaceae bacterium]